MRETSVLLNAPATAGIFKQNQAITAFWKPLKTLKPQ
jgi:hypothetical protein